jgi:hypothetical protein
MSLNLSWNEFRRFSSLNKILLKDLDFFCRLCFVFLGRGSWKWFHCLLIFNAVLILIIFSLVQNFEEFSVTLLECFLIIVSVTRFQRFESIKISSCFYFTFFLFFLIWSHNFKKNQLKFSPIPKINKGTST